MHNHLRAGLLFLTLAISPLALRAQGSSPLEPDTVPKPRDRNTVVWFGVSAVVNGHGGFEIGGRYRFVGFSFGSADNSFGWDTPTPLDYSVPHSDYKTIEFDGGDYIAQVFGFLDLTNYFAVYASGGYNWKGYQSIDRSNVTGLYYKSAQSGRFGDGGVAYGTGAQFTLFRFLAIGGGYNVPAGIEAHVGYRF